MTTKPVLAETLPWRAPARRKPKPRKRAGANSRNKRFSGFGPSILSRHVRGNLQRQIFPDDRLEARQMLRDLCPFTPGVYGWIDRDDQLIYVGKSKSLRSRLLSYFDKNPSDPKMSRIVQSSVRIVWEPVSHELLALIREQELINRWRPDFNKQGQPTRTQPAYLCIGSGAAPNAYLARRSSEKAAWSFGPVSGTGRLRDAIVALNHAFELRDCPDKTGFEFSNQLTLFEDPQSAQCIRYELGSCPGPCAGLCAKGTYRDRVAKATAFLQGDDRSILQLLETEMNKAADGLAYETAAIKRDYLHQLTWLDRRMSGLRGARSRLNGVIPVAGRARGRSAWIVLKGGRVLTTIRVPRQEAEFETAVEQLRMFAEMPFELPDSVLHMNLQLIVISWLRKYPEDRKRLVGFEDAIAQCRKREDPRKLSA